MVRFILRSNHILTYDSNDKVWNGVDWIDASKVKKDDLIPIRYGQNVWPEGTKIFDEFFTGFQRKYNKRKFNDSMTLDQFIYLIGLIISGGFFDRQGIWLSKKNDYVKNFGLWSGFREVKYKPSTMVIYSAELRDFFDELGLRGDGNHYRKSLDFLNGVDKNQARLLLQGIFDANSYFLPVNCSAHSLHLKLSSASFDFLCKIRDILQNFGIVATISTIRKRKHFKNNKVYNNCEMKISGYFCYLFFKEIGFKNCERQIKINTISQRIRSESGNIYPLDAEKYDESRFSVVIRNKSRMTRRQIKRLNDEYPTPYFIKVLEDNYYYSPVKEILSS